MTGEATTSTTMLRRFFVWTRRLLLLVLALAGLGMIGVALLVRHHERDLPSVDELKRYSPPQVTRILARDGSLLGEDFVERRTVVKIGDVPAQVKLAFLAAEDASFFEHEGLDYAGMLRAMWVNLRSSSKQGASTITQQVAKNFLTGNETSINRKIKEALLALRIERAIAEAEFDILFRREMVSGSYDPRWVTVQIDGIDKPKKALCFLMNRAHERYAGRLADATVADAIAKAVGPLGACRDYLEHTVAALEALGIHDRPLARMQKMVKERLAAAA